MARTQPDLDGGTFTVEDKPAKPATADEQMYSGCNHAIGPGFHMSIGNPSFLLRIGHKSWLTEWHYYLGPMVVLKNGDEAKNQPGERSAFWIIAQWWKDQGCRVVDGVGIWDEPETHTVTCAKTGRQIRFWKGYERLGAVRRL